MLHELEYQSLTANSSYCTHLFLVICVDVHELNFWPAAGKSKFIGLFIRFSAPEIVLKYRFRILSSRELITYLVWFDLLWSKRDIECLLDPLAYALGQAGFQVVALSRPGAR